MSLYTDKKFASLVSYRLSLYNVKSEEPFVAAFRCPYCGDSQKSDTKTRGNLFAADDKVSYHCYNCGVGKSLYSFLNDQDPELAKSYVADTVFERRDAKRTARQKTEEPKKKEDVRVSIKGLTCVADLRDDHPLFVYLEKRMIPRKHYHNLYYTKTFSAWVNTHIPDKLDVKYDEPRLVLPFFDRDKKLFGVTGRSLKKTGLRYVTIMFDGDEDKFFGMDRIDFTKPYKVVEGGIDSFFLDNCLAMAGADAKVNTLPNPSNMTIVYDNEPRNNEIHARMRKDIANGFKVCVWPSGIAEKDINAMVLGGVSDIEKIISDNTYSGLMAEAKLAFWAKSKQENKNEHSRRRKYPSL